MGAFSLNAMEVPQSREAVEEAQNKTYSKRRMESIHVRYTIGANAGTEDELNRETAEILGTKQFREDFPNEFSPLQHKVFVEDAGFGQFNVHIIG